MHTMPAMCIVNTRSYPQRIIFETAFGYRQRKRSRPRFQSHDRVGSGYRPREPYVGMKAFWQSAALAVWQV
jgi:hypothetical protein